mmetsp:Transcript_10894/g.11029  ORF Transcript_10894/g.11029 Transcript_10894/m.11029 type:complete len:130 (+) Transcript_10894:140-529(+)
MGQNIQANIPEAEILINKIPKEWVDYEIYCQLIPNSEQNEPHYQMIPRTGAFEVSFKGVLLFSKLLSGMWPHFDSVGKKAAKMFDDYKAGKDITIFQTQGTEDKRNPDSMKRTMKASSPDKMVNITAGT